MTRKLIGICCGIGLTIALAASAFAQNALPGNAQAPGQPAIPPPGASAAQPQIAQPSNAPTISGPAVVVWRGTDQKREDASKDKSDKSWTPIIVAALWPFATILLAILIVSSPTLMSALRQIAERISKIKGPGGIEVELTPEAAKKIRAEIGDTLAELMGKADVEYSRAVSVGRIWQRLGDVVWLTLPAILTAHAVQHAIRPRARATIHVPDIVFKEYLYQLTKYYVRTENGAGVEGAPGGRYSMRFGIIGRAWRLQESLGVGNALPGVAAARAAAAAAPTRLDAETKELIKDWGMFEEEAQPGSHGNLAYLCVILRCEDDGLPEGLLFIDSPTAGAFGSNQIALQVAEAIGRDNRVRELARAIAEEMKKLRESGPFLQVSR